MFSDKAQKIMVDKSINNEKEEGEEEIMMELDIEEPQLEDQQMQKRTIINLPKDLL